MVIRLRGNYKTREVYLNERLLTPSIGCQLINKSPDGFAWGYAGSGPSQLALSILVDLFPAWFALNYYQNFKQVFICNIPQEDFNVEMNLLPWLQAIRKSTLKYGDPEHAIRVARIIEHELIFLN
jgi:hypothetical protein